MMPLVFQMLLSGPRQKFTRISWAISFDYYSHYDEIILFDLLDSCTVTPPSETSSFMEPEEVEAADHHVGGKGRDLHSRAGLQHIRHLDVHRVAAAFRDNFLCYNTCGKAEK
jgi:hypothetical protein